MASGLASGLTGGGSLAGGISSCYTNPATGAKHGDCSAADLYGSSSSYQIPNAQPPAAPAPAAAPSSGSFSYTPWPGSDTPAVSAPTPPPITAPGPTAPGPQQQPQSIVSLGNQMQQPLDAINEDATPSLRDNLGRRTPPSMSALLAQMARVY